jgi:AraC-like DNA-binding protein
MMSCYYILNRQVISGELSDNIRGRIFDLPGHQAGDVWVLIKKAALLLASTHIPNMNSITGILALVFFLTYDGAYGQEKSAPVVNVTYTTELSEKLTTYRRLVSQYPDSVIGMILPDLDTYTASSEVDIASRALYLIGVSYYFKGQYILSNYYYRQVLTLDPKVVSDEVLEAVHNNKGVNYDILLLFDRAIGHYEESNRLAQKFNNKLGIAQTELNVGVLKNKMGFVDEAVMYTRSALHVFEELDDQFHIGLASMNLGAYLDFMGDTTGRTHLYSAMDLFYKFGADRNIAHVYYHLASSYLREERIDLSIAYAENAMSRMPESLYNDIQIQNMNLLIFLYDKAGRTDEALALIARILLAIESEAVTSVANLQDFWNTSTRVYSRLNRGQDIVTLLDMKDSFEKKVRAEVYAPLAAEYLSVKELSPEYAEALARYFPMLNQFTNTNEYSKTFILLLLVSVSFLLFYFSLREKSSITDLNTDKLDYIVRRITQSDGATVPSDGDQNDINTAEFPEKLFAQIETYLLDNDLYLRETVSREEVARKLFTNVKYVSHAIKRNTNLSFTEYLNYLRISNAVKLLQSGNPGMSMSELSELCGYSSEATFYRNFKSIVGVSPNKFRDIVSSGTNYNQMANFNNRIRLRMAT